MKQRTVSQPCRAICLSLFVDKQRKRDAALPAEYLGVAHIAQSNGSQGRPFFAERFFVVAQLRDVLAAENSAVVTQEGNDGRPIRP